MKNLLFSALASLLFPTTASAINHYQIGDTLFVWATSGLVLRADRDFKAKKIETVPFGAALVCLNEKFGASNQTIEALPSFQIGKGYGHSPALRLRGQFLKVKFNGKEGFVFDAYLTSLPTPKLIVLEGEKEWQRTIRYPEMTEWLAEAFGLLKKIERHYPKSDEMVETTLVFGNGIIEQGTRSMKGGSSSTVFPNFSIEEVYLIFNVFHSYEEEVKRKMSGLDKYDYGMGFEQSENMLSFDKGVCGYTIRFIKEGSVVIFSTECSC